MFNVDPEIVPNAAFAIVYEIGNPLSAVAVKATLLESIHPNSKVWSQVIVWSALVISNSAPVKAIM
ncbi:hypothetical protein D3C85_1917300 [compost metagenome]